MTDREKADLVFAAVKPLRHLAATLAGSPEGAAAQAAADTLQPLGSMFWALSRGVPASRIAELQGPHS